MSSIRKWKTIGSEKVLSTPIFSICKKKSISPRTGKEGDFFVIDFPFSWVVVVAVTHDNKLVMIRQFRHGIEEVDLEIPGGLIEKEESPLEAGLRELKEETGYTGENARIIGRVCPNPALQGNWCYTVFVENAVLSSDLQLDDCEDIETLLVPLHEAKAFILDGSVRNGLVLNALSFYFLRTENCN